MSMIPLNQSTDTLISSTVDGNYTYRAFASDTSGTDYSLSYAEGTHFYEAIKITETEIENPSLSTFTGLWIPIKEHTYKAFADDSSGTAFSTTYNDTTHAYEATITSIEGLTPLVSDFTGEWTPMQKVYTYVAYSDSINGVNFTTTYDDQKLYFAVLNTDVYIDTLSVSDFVGKWQPISRKSSVFNYEKLTTVYDIEMQGTGNVLGAGHLGPAGVHYKNIHNRIYFSWFNSYKDWIGQIKGTEESAHWVAYVDCDSGIVSTPIKLPMYYNHGTDTHSIPAISISDDGHIIVIYETLNANDNNSAHNSPFDIWRSDVAETIEDPNSPGDHHFTKVGVIPGPHSYPHIVKSTNGDIFCFQRSYLSSHKYMTGFKSIDNGINWISLDGTPNSYTTIIDYDRPGAGMDWFFYNYMVEGDQDNGINFVCIGNEGYNGATGPDGTTPNENFKTMYFIHSDDGVTWENVNNYLGTSGTFTKNILTAGALDYNDLQNNCLVDDQSLVVDTGYFFQWSGLDNELGVPFILYGIITRPDAGVYSNELLNLMLAYFDTGTNAWVKTDYLSLKDIGTDVTTNALPYGGSMAYFRAYSLTTWELILNRVIPDTRYVTPHTPTSSISDLYVGAMIRIVTQTTSFAGFSVGDLAYVYYSGGNLALYPGTTAVPIVLDASNTVELVNQESIVLRTDDAGNTWTLINTFENKENYMFANGRYTMGFGDVSDYHLLIQYVSKLTPGAAVDSTGSGGLNLILGKRI